MALYIDLGTFLKKGPMRSDRQTFKIANIAADTQFYTLRTGTQFYKQGKLTISGCEGGTNENVVTGNAWYHNNAGLVYAGVDKS